MLVGVVDQPTLGISVHGLVSGPLNLPSSPSSSDDTETPDPHQAFYSDGGEEFYPPDVLQQIKSHIEPAVTENQNLNPFVPTTFPGSEVSLDIDNSVTYWRKQYPIPRKNRQSLNDHFAKLLEARHIEEAEPDCPYNLPHCSAPKKHPITREKVDIRWCLDPRPLNEHLPPTPNILPKMHDLFADMEGSCIFSAVDLKHAYLQFNLKKEDRDKTAFTATINGKHGKWRYTRAIWGIRHLSHHVQSVMKKVFFDMPFVIIYIDDIVVHSRSITDHLEHLRLTLARLSKYNFIVNFEKSNFGMQRFRAFGHIASGSTLAADPLKVSAVLAWPVPTSGKEVESFLGFVNWLREFIPNFAAISAPMDSLRKLKSFTWSSVHQRSFDALKKLVEHRVQIFHPKEDELLQVATDASNYAVGGVLYQEYDGRIHILSLYSKSLNKSQRNYSATKRELWAIVACCRAFREWLYGSYFHLFTDHKALVFLHTQRALNPMLLNWFEELYELDFDIFHRPGTENVLPDTLSRVFKYFLGKDFKISPVPSSSFLHTKHTSPHSSSSSASISSIVATPSSSSSSVPSLEDPTSITPNDIPDTVFHIPTSSLEHKPLQALKRLVKDILLLEVPSTEKQQSLLSNEHEQGHFGSRSIVKAIIQKGFYWPLLAKDAEKLTGNCKSCQRFNIVREGFHPLRSIPLISRFNHWAIDLATDLPESPEHFKHILVILIRGSEFRLLVPLKEKTSTAVASALWSRISIFGPPAIVQSDRGPEFIADVFASLTKVHGINHRLVAQYNPRANGAVEKCVGTTKKVLVKLCNGADHNWPSYLPSIEFFFNRKINPTTGSSPFSLMFGRPITELTDYSSYVPDGLSPEEFSKFSKNLFEELDSFIFPAISERASNVHSALATQVNSNRVTHSDPLPVGSFVNVTSDPFERKIFGAQQSQGPFIITGVSKNKLYSLADDHGKPFDRPVPISQLKLLHHLTIDDFNAQAEDGENTSVTKVLDMKVEDGETFYLLKLRGVAIPQWTPADMCQCPSKIRAFRREHKQAASSTPSSSTAISSSPSVEDTQRMAASLKIGSLVAIRDSESTLLDSRYLFGELISMQKDDFTVHYYSVDTGNARKLQPSQPPRFRKTWIDPRDGRPTFSKSLNKVSCSPWTGVHDFSDILAVNLTLKRNASLTPPSQSLLCNLLPTTLQEINARNLISSKLS